MGVELVSDDKDESDLVEKLQHLDTLLQAYVEKHETLEEELETLLEHLNVSKTDYETFKTTGKFPNTVPGVAYELRVHSLLDALIKKLPEE